MDEPPARVVAAPGVRLERSDCGIEQLARSLEVAARERVVRTAYDRGVVLGRIIYHGPSATRQ